MGWDESDYSRDTIARLARSGAKISISCAQDACEVCRSVAGKVYAPSDTPHLPIEGCKNPRCHCQFVAVDPQSKLTVPELVRRGIQAFKAGQNSLARQILERAVTLDTMSEQGWLWLSGLVNDRSKIGCLEKVLSINPQNEHAQAGLASLRKRQQAVAAPVQAAEQRLITADQSLSQTPAVSPARPRSGELPPELVEARAERQIILEQLGEFLSIAAATDPEMLLMQGKAFLAKMKRLNFEALQAIPSERQQEELQLQWQESEMIGEALASLLADLDLKAQPAWDDMQQSLRLLAQELLDHRNKLRTKIQNTGG